MLGSGDPTPYDSDALVLLGALAVVLLFGAIAGANWVSAWAGYVRWGAMLTALTIFSVVHLVTPTANGIVGAGRMLTIWPAAFGCVVLFLVWSWRIGHL